MTKELSKEQVQDFVNSKDLVVVMKFGSHLYGTNTPESDTDYKGIYIPELSDVIMGNIPKASKTMSTGKKEGKNTHEDIDLEMFHLKGFLKLCEEGQVCALDMLFAPDDMILYKSPVWDEIIKNRDKLLHKKVTAFIGYCRKQTAKYGIKGSRLDALDKAIEVFSVKEPKEQLCKFQRELLVLTNQYPEFFEFGELENAQRNIGGGGIKDNWATQYFTFADRKFMLNSKAKDTLSVLMKIKKAYGDRAKLAQDSKGVDWKAVSHAVRVCYQAEELLRTGHITMPLKEAEFIKKIKQGGLRYINIAMLLEEFMDAIKDLKETSSLPEEPDREWMKEFCINSYMREYFNLNLIIDSLKFNNGKESK